MIVVWVALFFSVGSVISDSAPYNPPLDLRSVSWAGITVVNDITVWFLASVLIGWKLAKTKLESIFLGGMFGLVAMAGYYALLPLTTSVIYDWEPVALVSISLVGGTLASFLGQIARQHPLVLVMCTTPLLGSVILRLHDATSASGVRVLDIIQLGILAAVAGTVIVLGYRANKKH